MILSHPCIRYAHIDSHRTLVIGTTLSMPEPGNSCNDDRLLELFEYLEVIKNEHKGKFDSVEIRGTSKANNDHPARIPHFMPQETVSKSGTYA